MFSSRVPAERHVNRLTAALAAHARTGRRLIDLTSTNPTTVGIAYPPDILAPLSARTGSTYAPHPFGLDSAREAVAADYARRGISVAPSRIVLTASTSEAYSTLLKLLCDPGSEVLVPAPSYPLFDHLTRLDGVACRAYGLSYRGRWELNAHSVDTAWTERIQAVLAVSPNNPTGSILTEAELTFLAERCAALGAALVVDEVFVDYPLAAASDVGSNRAAAGWSDRALTFRLGGLSKSAGLPQVKLGWIAVDGPDTLVGEALDRLELILDTYLSMKSGACWCRVYPRPLIHSPGSSTGRCSSS